MLSLISYPIFLSHILLIKASEDTKYFSKNLFTKSISHCSIGIIGLPTPFPISGMFPVVIDIPYDLVTLFCIKKEFISLGDL